jgi:aryl-alcohol dehydrogenase-like predicted oxidoreductase
MQTGIVGLGGQATLQFGRKEDALPIIESALNLGVGYFDTSPVYGPSEDYLGEGLSGRRDGVLLATKTEDRTRDGSLRLLDNSLRRLRTDHVDLWQLHDLRTAADIDAIFAPDGAIAALEEAKADGRARFVGLTGHFDPAVLLQALSRYPFDALLLSLNVADRYRQAFATELLPAAVQRGMAIIAMKVHGAGTLPNLGFGPRETLSYVLSLPVSTAIIGCESPAHVASNVATARDFTPLSQDARAALERRAQSVAAQALFFRRA